MLLDSVAYPPTRFIHPPYFHPRRHLSTVTYVSRIELTTVRKAIEPGRLVMLGTNHLGNRVLLWDRPLEGCSGRFLDLYCQTGVFKDLERAVGSGKSLMTRFYLCELDTT